MTLFGDVIMDSAKTLVSAVVVGAFGAALTLAGTQEFYNLHY